MSPGIIGSPKLKLSAGRGARPAGRTFRVAATGRSGQYPVHLGTTGSPKAATLTHHGLLNNGYFFGIMAGLKEGDRYGTPMPLYHVGGMVVGSITGIAVGVTIIYLGEAFDPIASLETIQSERCSHFCGVPTMFIAILNNEHFARSTCAVCAAGGPAAPRCRPIRCGGRWMT